jgi:type IV secretory pathway VirJ component
MRNCFVVLLLLLVAQPGNASNGAERVQDSRALGDLTTATKSNDISDLPLSEVPAAKAGDTLALLVTGDGGWAPLDQNVSAELARRGIAVVGLSSLKYFWRSRTPELAARDVTNVLRHYLGAWRRSRVVLIGYSFGADVMPFIVNRLPQDIRARVISINLLGPSANATFQVSVSDLIHSGSAASRPVAPELFRIADVPVLCIHGEGEQDSLCPTLAQRTVTSVRIGEGHHFGNQYGAVAEEIAAFAARSRRSDSSLSSV